MKKNLIKIILFISLCLNCFQPLFAEDTTPLPYDEEEFPETLKDLRRFEIISLGSMPFVTLDVTLVYTGVKWVEWYKRNEERKKREANGESTEGFDNDPMPSIFSASTWTQEEQKKIILQSLGISIGIGFTDYSYRVVKRIINENKTKKQEKNIIVTPISEDPDAIKLDNPFNETDSVIEEPDTVIDEPEIVNEETEIFEVEEIIEIQDEVEVIE